MRGVNYIRIFFCLFILLKSFVASSQGQANYVIVIGIDGLSSWSIKKYLPPTIDSLMEQGTYSLSTEAVSPTLSAPNWASILTGLKPNVHHIKSNHWKTTEYDKLNSPTIFQMIRNYDSAISQSVFYQWKEFEQLIDQDFFVNKNYCKNEVATIASTIESFNSNEFRFAFIHLDNVDSAGHNFGHRSKEYFNAVNKVDYLINNLVTAVNKSSMRDNVYILITSDHGFWGKHHGGNSKREKNIPWILTGPGVRKNYAIKSDLETQDTTAIIYYLLSKVSLTNKNELLIKEIFQKQ